MGFDHSVRFESSECYRDKRLEFARYARELPSFVPASPGIEEVWLKDPSSNDPWAYDTRLFFREDALSVEVSSFTQSFHRDVRALIARISAECRAVLVDDDGEPI